jgi:hypothetical protein
MAFVLRRKVALIGIGLLTDRAFPFLGSQIFYFVDDFHMSLAVHETFVA